MSGADSVMWALDRNWAMVEAALEGLDDETMSKQPAGHSNSIAWIFWHMNRVVDNFINSRLQSRAQLWVRDAWYLRFGMEEAGSTMGYSEDDLAQWTAPPRPAQMGYFEAVKADARKYIKSLSNEDLDRKVTFPPAAETRDHTIATGLGQLVWDNVAHGGQIAYLRGLFEGLGWHR